MRFLIGNDCDRMLEHLRAKSLRFAAVEAEWGTKAIGLDEGALAAYNHHDGRTGLCPAMAMNSTDPNAVQLVALSHFDLDTLLGCMALLGIKPNTESGFCHLAQHVDLNGPHRIHKAKEPQWEEVDIQHLHAFWAWSKANRVEAPRDGSVLDITQEVEIASDVLFRIFGGDEGLLKAGQELRETEQRLNQISWAGMLDDKVIMRTAAEFTNHLYVSPDGRMALGICSLNPQTGKVTLSLESPIDGVDCSEIARALWGPKAGGHPGIAGSPRGVELDNQEWQKAGLALLQAIVRTTERQPKPAAETVVE